MLSSLNRKERPVFSVSPKQLRLPVWQVQPCASNFLAVGAAAHGAITRHQRFVNRQEAAVDGKSPGRQQRIVKEVGARTVAAHNEDWAA